MNKLLAALMFFTRLPLWRIANVPSDAFKRVVDLWPLTGWLTGGLAAGVLYLLSLFMPLQVAVVAALLVRLLLTGALHEDGLADFCDGMGAGGGRERILAIMKDSHIGSYGVLGLIFLFLFATAVLSSLPPAISALTLLGSDPFAKMCAAQTINLLPYARNAETAKNHTVYDRMSLPALLLCIVCGVLPSLPLLMISFRLCLGAVCCAAVCGSLLWMLHRRLHGYTGDCCGALFLIGEMAYYFGIVVAFYL